jgi:ferric-dicitrate binding protein FerR (iron transport regulator)
MSPRPDDAAILRYVSGESSLAESQQIEDYLAADPDLAASIAELRAAWSSPPPSTPSWQKADVWHRISAEIRPSRLAKPTRRWQWPVAIAATLVLATGISIYQALRPVAPELPISWREVTTARAQQAVLDLADGSRVTLAAATTLKIPSNFTTRREIQLVGRAHFEVKHDTTRPFLVHTKTATTEDIGTAFVITAYPESKKTQVVVTDGAVALRQLASAGASAPTKPLLTLSKGDVATLDSSGTATLTRNAALAPYLSWTKGILTIDNTPLRDAIADIERWYDIDIRLADRGLGDRRVTAQLRSEPASRAAERLALILGVRASSDATGRVITLRRKP